MDKYDKHIAEFVNLTGKAFSRKINQDWLDGKGLFQFLCNQKTSRPRDIGCPIMIRAGYINKHYAQFRAETESLTLAAQQADLPTEVDLLQPAHFQILAQLQRQADSELGRI